MKVLIITQNFPPEPGSSAMRMFELGKYLLDCGHQVSVVTSLPNYPAGVIYREYRGKLYCKEKVEGITVLRTFVYTSPRRKKILPRLLNYLSFMLASVFAALSLGRHELIYVYLPPPFLGFSAWFIGRLFRVPYVAEFNDLWPKTPLKKHIVSNRLLVELASLLERFVYATAGRLFIYSKRIGQSMVEGGASWGRIELIPLWVDTRVFRPQPEAEVERLRRQYQLEDKFVIMYAGLMGLPQALDCCLECAGLLRRRRKVVFVFVGDGPEKGHLLRMKKSRKLKNVVFIPPQPKEVIPQFLSLADVLLAHLKKAPHRLGTVPAKILAYMSCGRPVLAAVAGESADLVRKYQCGLAVEPDDPEAMAEGVERLSGSKKLCQQMGANGRAAALKDFNREILLPRLESELRKVVA